MDQAIESGDKDQVAFRQRFGPRDARAAGLGARICKLQFDLSRQTDPESDSLLLQSGSRCSWPGWMG